MSSTRYPAYLSLSGGTLTGPLVVPAGTASLPGIAVGHANTGMFEVDGSTSTYELAWSLNGVQAMSLLGAASGPVYGLVLGTDTHLANLYVSGQTLVMNSGTQQVGIGASCSIGNGAIDGVCILSGDMTSNGNAQGGNVLLYGHTHLTKADLVEIYSAGALTATFNTLKQLVFSDTTKSIKGTTTNNNAAAGNIGEYVESVGTDAAYGGSSGNYFDLATISLTAGDWDVSAIAAFYNVNVAGITEIKLGISTGTAGNFFTDEKDGNNTAVSDVLLANGLTNTMSVPSYRLSLSGSATVILKAELQFAGGTPHYAGYRISARRVR